MFLIVLISLLLILAYDTLIGFYRKSWKQIPEFQSRSAVSSVPVKITVIVPARNEEMNIGDCLLSLRGQHYPASHFQIIVVDDHSTDGTWKKVNEFAGNGMNIRCLRLEDYARDREEIFSFKKFAIETAVKESMGDLIITTDADCRPGPEWLSVIAEFYCQTKAKIIAAPVRIETKGTLLSVFQTLDFLALQGITGSALSRKIHSMANGANLAFEKGTFVEVGGYRDSDNIPSGDDMFLMHKVFRKYPDDVHFLKSKDAIVTTLPESTWKSFLQQRIRWSSKADRYQDKSLFRILFFVYLFNFFFLGLFFACFLDHRFLYLLFPLLILKTGIEFPFVRRIAQFFDQQKWMRFFPILQPLHILYVLVVGWLGKFGSYRWKGRRIEKMSPQRSVSFSRNVWRRLKRNRGAVFGMILITLSILIALTGYFVAPDHSPDANRMILEIGGRKPGFKQQFLLLKKEGTRKPFSFLSRLIHGMEDGYQYIPINGYEQKNDSLVLIQYMDEGVEERVAYPISKAQVNGDGINPPYLVQSRTFWLGTDQYGRDILSRLLIGVRVSLSVGLVTVIISLSIGVLLGALAGYFRGHVDDLVMWFINVIWSIPSLLLVFAITLILGKGFWQIFIAIGLILWVNTARIVRGQVMVVRKLEYVDAARALGYSTFRIIFRHILPNVMGPVMVVAASNFASAIIIEAGLSFLGVGVQPPQPSWGLMIKENYNFIITHNPMLALAPGIAIMLLVLAFNLLGNGLRDAMDVRG
jgi:ABC-type dipeptide/oligopeptide/nickel transport system permease subunit/cellulose synthase/poly-beta-1,6-N-acetylglucosamine synthase-like glycosyltransferase